MPKRSKQMRQDSFFFKGIYTPRPSQKEESDSSSLRFKMSPGRWFIPTGSRTTVRCKLLNWIVLLLRGADLCFKYHGRGLDEQRPADLKLFPESDGLHLILESQFQAHGLELLTSKGTRDQKDPDYNLTLALPRDGSEWDILGACKDHWLTCPLEA